jgi:N-acyl-D-amino-acid deacylase
MLSLGRTNHCLHDGRSQSDIRQGVHARDHGRGESMGPLNDAMKKDMVSQQADLKYDVAWTTLGEYLDHLVRRGVSCNVGVVCSARPRCAFTRSATRTARPRPTNWNACAASCRRRHGRGRDGRGVVDYLCARHSIAKTDELLVAFPKAGCRIQRPLHSHIRSEGNSFLEALD